MAIKKELTTTWALHNFLRGWTLKGLSLNEALIVVRTLSHADKLETYVYSNGYQNWIPLKSVDILKSSPEIKPMTLPPLPNLSDEDRGSGAPSEEESNTGEKMAVVPSHSFENSTHSPGSPTSVDASTKLTNDVIEIGKRLTNTTATKTTNTNKSLNYKRIHERFDKEIKIKVKINDQKFVTTTENVSLGGFLLKEALPDWVVGYFTAYIELLEDKYLPLICSIAEGEAYYKKRLIIADQNPEKNIKIYSLWLQQIATQSSLE